VFRVISADVTRNMNVGPVVTYYAAVRLGLGNANLNLI